MENTSSASVNEPTLSESFLKSLEKEHWTGCFPLPSPDSSVSGSAADFSPYALSSVASSSPPRSTRSSSISPIAAAASLDVDSDSCTHAALPQHTYTHTHAACVDHRAPAAAAPLRLEEELACAGGGGHPMMSPPTILLQQLSAHPRYGHQHQRSHHHRFAHAHASTSSTPMSMCPPPPPSTGMSPPSPPSCSSHAAHHNNAMAAAYAHGNISRETARRQLQAQQQLNGVVTSFRATAATRNRTQNHRRPQCATATTPHSQPHAASVGRARAHSHHFLSALQLQLQPQPQANNAHCHGQRPPVFVSPNNSMKRKRSCSSSTSSSATSSSSSEVCPHDRNRDHDLQQLHLQLQLQQQSTNLEQARAPHDHGDVHNVILDSPLSMSTATAENDMDMQPSPLKRRRVLARGGGASIADDTVAVDIGDGHRSQILHRVVDHLYTAILRASVSSSPHHRGSVISRAQQKDIFADPSERSKTTYGCVSVFLQRLVNLFWGTAPALTVTSLILLERFLHMSQRTLHEKNWRGLVQTAYLVAHKMLEDESYTNLVYAGAMKHCTVTHLNAMEIKFMEVIKFDAYVKPSLFNKFAQAVLTNERPIPSAYDSTAAAMPSPSSTDSPRRTRAPGTWSPLPFSAQMPATSRRTNNTPTLRVPAFQPDTSSYTCVPVYPTNGVPVYPNPNASVTNQHASTCVGHPLSYVDALAPAAADNHLGIVSRLLEVQAHNLGGAAGTGVRPLTPQVATACASAGARVQQHLQGLPLPISVSSAAAAAVASSYRAHSSASAHPSMAIAHQNALLELYQHAARHCGLSAAMQMNLNPYIAAGQ